MSPVPGGKTDRRRMQSPQRNLSTANSKFQVEMKPRIRHRHGYEVMREAIRPEDVERIAARLGAHPDTVRRWCRPPESNEQPTESGRRSPYDAFLDLVESDFLDNPDGSALLVDGAKTRLLELQRIHSSGKFDERLTVAQMADHLADTAGELLDGDLNENDLRKLRTFHRFLGRKIEEAASALEQRKGGGRKR
jgi:hypothetical protein